MSKVICDTGPLVALIDQEDEFHAWAKEQIRKMEDPLLTCDAVLTETCFLLRKHPVAFRHVQSLLAKKLIVSTFSSNRLSQHIFELMETYRNVPMSFADACLVCMVESHPGSALFTLDSDFTVIGSSAAGLSR